jgi:O-antigen ligase
MPGDLLTASRDTRDWWRRRASPAAPAVRRRAGARGAVRSEAAFRLTLALVALVLVAPQERIPALAALRPAFVVAGLAIAAALASRLGWHEPLSVSSPALRLAGMLLGWAIVTMPLSSWPGGSLAALQAVFAKSLAAFWLIANVAGTGRRLAGLAWVLALAAVPGIVTAIVDYRSGALAAGRIEGYRSGLMGNPNDLALTLSLVLPLTLALIAGTRRLGPRLLLVSLAALSVVAVILTFSRAGFVTLAVVLGGSAWRFARRSHAAVATVLLLALAAAAFLPGGYVDRVSTLADFEADPTGSATLRWNDMLAATRYVAAHPIVGAGLGMDMLALNQARGERWSVVHNVYLQHAVDLGVPGAALFVALLVAAIRAAGRARQRRDPLGHLAAGAEIALVAFAVAAVSYPVAYHFYFYVLAGLAVAAECARESEPRTV